MHKEESLLCIASQLLSVLGSSGVLKLDSSPLSNWCFCREIRAGTSYSAILLMSLSSLLADPDDCVLASLRSCVSQFLKRP